MGTPKGDLLEYAYSYLTGTRALASFRIHVENAAARQE
jgi:hypothetical protein